MYNRCECIGLFCSIGFDACKPVDYPSRAREADPAEELEDEADLGQEEPDGFGGTVRGGDELEPVIRTKKRQRKSQSSGKVLSGSFCLKSLLWSESLYAVSTTSQDGDHRLGFYEGHLRELLMTVQLHGRRTTAIDHAFPCPMDFDYEMQTAFEEQAKPYVRSRCTCSSCL